MNKSSFFSPQVFIICDLNILFIQVILFLKNAFVTFAFQIICAEFVLMCFIFTKWNYIWLRFIQFFMQKANKKRTNSKIWLTLLDLGGVDSTTFSEFAKFCLIPLNKRVPRLSDF